jgi:FeS assembly SUF system protein
MNRLARFAGFGGHEHQPEESNVVADQGLRDVHTPCLDPEAMRAAIVEALRGVYDPEIPVNIYDLGLIYQIEVGPSADVVVDMTLTAPACPVAGMMPKMVEEAVGQVEGVGDIAVNLVWDPPWGPERMSDEARLELGMM